jgi:hypothetical protein
VTVRTPSNAIPLSRTSVTAILVAADGRLTEVTLVGDDSNRFAQIRQLIGGQLAAVDIEDQDARAALGWIDGDAARKRLAVNPVVSTVLDRPVLGPVVVTGLGRGDDCLTSIHAGLMAVLAQLADQLAHPDAATTFDPVQAPRVAG